MSDYKELINEARNCVDRNTKCAICHYKESQGERDFCIDIMIRDLADAIEQLVRERNAALADLKELADCDYCKYGKGNDCEDTLHDYCTVGEDWEWRGVQDEQTN